VVPESFPATTTWLAALVMIALVVATYLWTERKARPLTN
jgi:hypothetical protein